MASRLRVSYSRIPTPISPQQARIVLIEDDVLLGDLLRLALLSRLRPADLRLFRHGRAGIDHCGASKPDLVVVDLGLPDMDGRQVIRALHSASPTTRIIVLTGQAAPSLAPQLLALGVAGYVEKGSSLESAESAILRVLEGGIHFSAGPRAVPQRAAVAASREVATFVPEVLDEREQEIVRLVANGMVSKEIGTRLNLSPRTVEKARSRISQKLHVRDLPSLIKWSVEHGLT